MKNNKGKILKKGNKQSGITLVALVVTIVVLLILAGISINLVLDNNGITKKAQEGKEKYANASANEQEQLDTVESDIDKILGIDKSEFGKIKSAGNYVEENKTVKDKNGDTVVIPKGFKVAEDSGSSVIEGVVIEDDDIFNGRGNQYVWVPVTKDTNGDATTPYSDSGTLSNGKEIQLAEYAFKSTGEKVLCTGAVYSYNYGQHGGSPFWCATENDDEVEPFKISAVANGGYYIARYEASYGTDGKANSRISTDNRNTTEELQKGTLWNYINQTDAISACENLYVETNSYLTNSYAWDTAIVYIQECSNTNDYSMKTTKNTNLANTGTIGDEQCKINDMAGNLGEWTTEGCAWRIGNTILNGGVNRGGRFSKTDYFTSFRGEYNNTYTVNATDISADVGFRAILYI
jgi:type II secretory pathway pseudopilin PulG